MKKNMKKLLSLLLILTIFATMTIGCTQTDSVDFDDKITDTNSDEKSNDSEKLESDEQGAGNENPKFSNLSTKQINTENIMNIIKELSSEKYSGRLPGTDGNSLAVKYIESYFKKIGLETPNELDGYLQVFDQKVRITNSAPTLSVIDKDGNTVTEYKYLEDFSPSTHVSIAKLKGESEGKVYEVRSISDISSENEEIKGKIVLLDSGIISEVGYSKFYTMMSDPELEIKAVIMGRTNNPSVQGQPYSFRVSPHPQMDIGLQNKDSLIFTYCDAETYIDILEKEKEDNIVKITIDYENAETKSANIIGVIPGTDKEMKNEYIIIGGHMDHVGDNKDGTYNSGALDNGSGTASVMEIARIIMENKVKPKKTIVFIAFNGEEEGLLGSKYYTDNPIYSLDKTTVINLDMVGSKRVIPLEVANATKMESDLRDTLYRYGKALGLDVKKTTLSASDHSPFAYKGSEAVLLIHLDRNSGYHTPGDTIETVDKDRISDVVKLVLYYLDQKAY